MNNRIQFKSTLAQCCCTNLRKVTRAVTQYYDHKLEPVHLRSTQFILLMTLANNQAKTMTELADTLIMDRTTLTRNLKPLERQLYVHKVDSSDKRSKNYALTDLGYNIIVEAMPLWQAAQSQILQHFPEERYMYLLSELTMVKAALYSPRKL